MRLVERELTGGSGVEGGGGRDGREGGVGVVADGGMGNFHGAEQVNIPTDFASLRMALRASEKMQGVYAEQEEEEEEEEDGTDEEEDNDDNQSNIKSVGRDCGTTRRKDPFTRNARQGKVGKRTRKKEEERHPEYMNIEKWTVYNIAESVSAQHTPMRGMVDSKLKIRTWSHIVCSPGVALVEGILPWNCVCVRENTRTHACTRTHRRVCTFQRESAHARTDAIADC